MSQSFQAVAQGSEFFRERGQSDAAISRFDARQWWLGLDFRLVNTSQTHLDGFGSFVALQVFPVASEVQRVASHFPCFDRSLRRFDRLRGVIDGVLGGFDAQIRSIDRSDAGKLLVDAADFAVDAPKIPVEVTKFPVDARKVFVDMPRFLVEARAFPVGASLWRVESQSRWGGNTSAGEDSDEMGARPPQAQWAAPSRPIFALGHFRTTAGMPVLPFFQLPCGEGIFDFSAGLLNNN